MVLQVSSIKEAMPLCRVLPIPLEAAAAILEEVQGEQTLVLCGEVEEGLASQADAYPPRP